MPSPVPPAHRHGVQRAFLQAEIELWPDMGHHPVRERFDALLALVVRATAPAEYAQTGDVAGPHTAAA